MSSKSTGSAVYRLNFFDEILKNLNSGRNESRIVQESNIQKEPQRQQLLDVNNMIYLIAYLMMVV